MKKFIDYITEEMMAAFVKAGYDKDYGKVTISNRPDLCEYQCNGAMAGGKKYKKAPLMIAEEVGGCLEGSPVFSSAQAVKPGFINLKIQEGLLAAYLHEMQKDDHLSVDVVKEP